MQVFERIQQNSEKIIRSCCCPKPGEQLLILTDEAQDMRLVNSLRDAAIAAGLNTNVLTIPVSVPGSELPAFANEAAMESDIILTPTTTSIYHAPGIHLACTEGHARLLALSECTSEMLSEGGIEADFSALLPVVQKVCTYYDAGSKIHYTTPAGTDITACIRGRHGCMNSGISSEAGQLNGLPTVEVFIAPVEESVNGTIAVDLSCSGGVGIIEEPIFICIEKGRAVSFSGGKQAAQLQAIVESTGDPRSRQVAELAIGLNPCCRITGKICEDEGKYGTCHMALGSNTSFGGINPAPVHIDMVQDRPTIIIDDVIICKDGRLLVADIPK